MPKIFQLFLPKALRNRIVLSFVSMSLIPVSLVLYVTGTSTRESIVDAEYEKAENIARQVKRELILHLTRIENVIRSVSGDPLITDPEVSDEAKRRELDRVSNSQALISSIERIRSTNFIPKEESPEIHLEFFGHQDRTSPLLSWKVTVPGTSDILLVKTPLSELWRILDSVELGGTGGALLIDSSHRILSYRDKTKLRSYLNTEQLGQKGNIYDSPDGKSFYTVLEKLDKQQYPYQVVLLFPKLPIDQLILATLLVQMIIGSITTALAWTLGFIVARRLTHGLSRISDMAQEVAGGNLEARLPEQGPTEVAHIAQSFNTMVGELEIHQNHLEDLVTERTSKLEKATIRHQELAAELQAAYDAGKDGLWLVHRDGATISHNATFGRMFGAQFKKGTPFHEALTLMGSKFSKPSDFCAWFQQAHAEPNNSRRTRWELVGEQGILATYASPVRGKNEEEAPYAILFSIADLTEETRIQKELEDARRFESVGHLVSSVAHEFNNLLAAVMGNIEFASDIDMPDAEKVRKPLREANRSATKAVELVRGLLSFSQQNLLDLSPTRSEEVIRETLLKFRKQHESSEKFHSVQWDIYVQPELPGIEADSMKLRQAIDALLENALNAVEPGGMISLRAETGQNEQGQSLVNISITDNGCGIAEEIHDRIFEPFFSTSDDRKGLGLAMCHGVVSQHNGALSCQSVVGTGTRMTIQLPAKVLAAAPDTAFRDPVSPGQASARIETILVIDDDHLVRTVTQKILQKGGYNVLAADSGALGLKIYRERKEEINLIVLDLRMPEMMGTEVLEHLFEEHGDSVPVIVCSGYLNDFETDLGRSPRLRPRGFLEKPVQANEMLEAVQKVALSG